MKKVVTKPNYESWPRQKVAITDLFLDPENIRLQVDVTTTPSQGALINDLFLNENAMQVLASIATNGFFPDEIPVVIREDKKFTVIDGNRRVAALKVLVRPEIVPTKEQPVKEILKTAEATPREIIVVVAPNRNDVRHFLASKHTQNTKRPWRPLRQAYFYKAELARGKTVENLRNEYPSVNIDKFLRLINIHKIAKSLKYDTDQVAKKVYDERSFPASTVERLYEAKQARNFLGFDFDKDGEVIIRIDRQEFEKGFKKVIQDAADSVIDTRILNNDKAIEKYLKSFSATEVPNKTKSGKASTSKDFTEKVFVMTKRRTRLAPRDINFSLPSPGVRRMLNELQGIDYHKFPNASHDLLRSFLECSLKIYFEAIGKPVKPATGKKYVFLEDVLKEFKKEMDLIKNPKLSQLTQKIISDVTMKSYSAQFLNATNHNPSIFAVDKDVEDAWDTLEELFRYILNPPKKHVKNKS